MWGFKLPEKNVLDSQVTSEIERLQQLMLSYGEYVKKLFPRRASPASRSDRTQTEYLQLGRLLFIRAKQSGDLQKVISDTGSPRTYAKRVAAARHYCRVNFFEALNVLTETEVMPTSEFSKKLSLISASLDSFLRFLPQLCETTEQGFMGVRKKKKTKRSALRGLAHEWREQISRRGASGKYATPLLVATVTGCRHSELVKGVRVWLQFDEEAGMECLMLHAKGSKARGVHGQPDRLLVYSSSNKNEVIQNLVDLIRKRPQHEMTIEIEKAVNFTTEVKRLAAILWPGHHETVTCSCFRHQFSGDLKKHGDRDMASKALGHQSAKTIKYYGTAGQSRSMIIPLRVETTYPVRHLDRQFSPSRASHDSSEGPENL